MDEYCNFLFIFFSNININTSIIDNTDERRGIYINIIILILVFTLVLLIFIVYLQQMCLEMKHVLRKWKCRFLIG